MILKDVNIWGMTRDPPYDYYRMTIMSGDIIYFSFNLKGKATASIAPTTRQAQKMKICVAPFAKV